MRQRLPLRNSLLFPFEVNIQERGSQAVDGSGPFFVLWRFNDYAGFVVSATAGRPYKTLLDAGLIGRADEGTTDGRTEAHLQGLLVIPPEFLRRDIGFDG